MNTPTKIFIAVAAAFMVSAYPLAPSLNIADTSTDVVDVGSAAAFDDMATGTIVAWIKPGTLANNQVFVNKFTSSTASLSFAESDASGNFKFQIEFTVTDLAAISSSAPLSTGSWFFVAATWNASGIGSDQKLYSGSLTSTIAEVSYSTQALGIGVRGSDAANNFGIGNRVPGNTTTAFSGDIAVVGIWEPILTIDQIRALQFNVRKTENCIGLWWLGFNGTGTQADFSGNLNNGTVTGATSSNNAPLPPPFGK